MVPVRSAEHTSAFLSGLEGEGLTVVVSTVDAAWVRSVVVRAKGEADAELAVGVPFSEQTAVVEGEVLFVEAAFRGGGTVFG